MTTGASDQHKDSRDPDQADDPAPDTSGGDTAPAVIERDVHGEPENPSG